MSWFHIHSWGKWEQFPRPGYLYNYQIRECSTCGLREKKLV